MSTLPFMPPTGLPSGQIGLSPRHRGSMGLRWLLAAPHRLGFFFGALMLGASALWWLGALLARHLGLDLPWAVNPATAHALVMSFGFMPFFVLGFLFTAGPRWLDVPAAPASALRLPVGLMAAGWPLAIAGFHTQVALAALGLAMAAAGLALVTGRFALMVIDSAVADRDHAMAVATGCGLGAVSLWAAAVAVALQQDAAARASVHFALWASLGLVFVAVAHRMIPFFTAAALPALQAWKPRAVLGLLLLGVLLQAPFAAAEAFLGALPPEVAGLRAAIEFPFGALLLWLALRWGLVQSLHHRLLAMLHMGFFWLGVAFTLGGVSHAVMSASGGTLSLGLAPLHAFTMGYLGSTLLAMATRVACGHAGRGLVADDWTWSLFWALQAGVLMRVAAALWPAAATPLTLLAAQFWLGAMGVWALRHGRWFLAPRADGQPG